MMHNFTNWIQWEKRNQLVDINYPGIYCIAVSEKLLNNFSFIPELEYIGMTNAKAGLKSRLNQFNNVIKNKKGKHGGADRFLFKYPNYEQFKEQIFVAIRSFKCNNKNPLPEDLRIMGEVPKCEYDCWALFIEKFGRYPKFNDKANAPKYSAMNG